ncbi:MAG: PIN domain nuclease [Micrococcales bacterium]|nr:MAG: PIN domain nuclease [Micrococcales bacterium]
MIELLRLCIVVFFAGLGSELGRLVPGGDDVGPLDPVAFGVLLGAAIGYVMGGVLARLTVRGLNEAERAISERSPERVFGSILGTLLGVFTAVSIGWPLLLIGSSAVTIPIFSFVVVSAGTLGHRIGSTKRHVLMRLISGSTRMSPASTDGLERIVDTSIAIDGRIVDVIRAGFLHGTLIVPQPVLGELQALADSGEDTKRGRGRRGLECLEALRRERGVEFEVVADGALEVPEVDGKLVRMCLDRPAVLLTLDTNLAKAASLAGCRVMNVHALALALRPPVVAGEVIEVLLTKAGREQGQAVGYLDDGTMVVVERARTRIGQEITVVVTSVLVTANGRMVFAKRVDAQDDDHDTARDRQSGGPLTPARMAAQLQSAVPTPRDVARTIRRDSDRTSA